MKRCLILFPVLALTACSPQKTTVSIATPSNVETVAETVEAVIDTAYGKPCMYVEADAEYSELTCAKGDVQPDWTPPADGWQEVTVGEKKYIHQVYSDGILLLPLDYGSNVYTIIGIDGEVPEDCSECPE